MTTEQTTLSDPAVPGVPGEPLEGPRAEIGVIGGSGLYEFLDDYETVDVETPFGSPSDPLVIGEVEGRSVAFVARHGKDHRFAPHRVNYRANLWALRAVGVRQILSPCAVGSLRPEHGPGTIVVPDQVVDRTWGRAHTIYEAEGPVVHVGFADPYCPNGRQVAVDAARLSALEVVTDGTLVVVNGPRFSSRAESLMHQQAGFGIVGMTTMPEAALAREPGHVLHDDRHGHRPRRRRRGRRRRHARRGAAGLRDQRRAPDLDPARRDRPDARPRARRDGHLPVPAQPRRPRAPFPLP